MSASIRSSLQVEEETLTRYRIKDANDKDLWIIKDTFQQLPTANPLKYDIGSPTEFSITDLPFLIKYDSGTYEEGLSKMSDLAYKSLENYQGMWKYLGSPQMAQWVFERKPTIFDGYVYEIGSRYAPTNTSHSRLVISKVVYAAGNGFASASHSAQEDKWSIKLHYVYCHHLKPYLQIVLSNHPYSSMYLTTWELLDWMHANDKEILHEMLSVKPNLEIMPKTIRGKIV